MYKEIFINHTILLNIDPSYSISSFREYVNKRGRERVRSYPDMKS